LTLNVAVNTGQRDCAACDHYKLAMSIVHKPVWSLTVARLHCRWH